MTLEARKIEQDQTIEIAVDGSFKIIIICKGQSVLMKVVKTYFPKIINQTLLDLLDWLKPFVDLGSAPQVKENSSHRHNLFLAGKKQQDSFFSRIENREADRIAPIYAWKMRKSFGKVPMKENKYSEIFNQNHTEILKLAKLFSFC